MRILLLNILFICFIINLLCQTHFDNTSRAKYIYDIASIIKWPENLKIDTFFIVLLTRDTGLINAMKDIITLKKKLQGKPCAVISASNYEELQKVKNYHLLFFNALENYNIYKINKIICSTALLISENVEYHKSMINFVVVNNVKRYEVNVDKLKEKGFSVPQLFIEGAVKNQTNWEELYKLTDYALEQSKEKIQQQQQIISSQEQKIYELNKTLLQLNDKINELNTEIKEKERLVEETKRYLNNLIYNTKKIEKNLKLKEKEITLKNSEIKEKSKILKSQQNEIKFQLRTIASQLDQIKKQKRILLKLSEQIKLQKIILILAGIALFLTIVAIILIFNNYKIKKKANEILTERNLQITKQNEEILQQNKIIIQQKDEIEKQKDEISRQKQEILDSIYYASIIQQSLLPSLEVIEKIFKDNYFLIYKPRDIVSGDFYYFSSINDKLYIAAADCTGHGVPGALMSALGISLINQIISENPDFSAAKILNNLRKLLIQSLHASENAIIKDGMDISFCIYNINEKILNFAGANNSIYLVRNNNIIEYKADKMPVGIYDKMENFTDNKILIESNDCLYLFSDGIASQFGGPEHKKLKYSNLKKIILKYANLSMKEQYNSIINELEEWQGNFPQVDDILLLGFKF